MLLVFKGPHPCSPKEQCKHHDELSEVRLYYGEGAEGIVSCQWWRASPPVKRDDKCLVKRIFVHLKNGVTPALFINSLLFKLDPD